MYIRGPSWVWLSSPSSWPMKRIRAAVRRPLSRALHVCTHGQTRHDRLETLRGAILIGAEKHTLLAFNLATREKHFVSLRSVLCSGATARRLQVITMYAALLKGSYRVRTSVWHWSLLGHPHARPPAPCASSWPWWSMGWTPAHTRHRKRSCLQASIEATAGDNNLAQNTGRWQNH